MTTPTTSSVGTTEQEFTISRVFAAPRALVWKAATESERLAQWWGPKGFTMQSATLDLRPGGAYHYGMRSPGGNIMWGKLVYREIVAPERLVFVTSFSDEQGNTKRNPYSAIWPLEVLNTWTFAEQDGKTTLTLRGRPLNANEAEQHAFTQGHASMQAGFKGTFAQLDEYLATVEREIVIVRRLNAPRELVFDAFTDPKHIGHWWGPNGFTTTTSAIDIRPGGAWQFVMHGPDGINYPNRIIYREIVRPERLAYTHGTGADPDPDQFEVLVTFGVAGATTQLTMRMLFESAAVRAQNVEQYGAIEGGNQTIDRLEHYLAALSLQ